MSYEIVKGLKLKKDVKEVWIKAASSNVTPRSYYWEELKGLSMRYKQDGEEEVVKVILKMYWEGTFHAGTKNNFYKAVAVFRAKHPKIGWDSIGAIKDEEICFCPLEDLPKYLNIPDRRVRDYVSHRLKGETFNRSTFKPQVVMTQDEFSDEVYDIYKNYRKRKKGKYLITITDRDPKVYFMKRGGKRKYWITEDINKAKVFPSWEDAAIHCTKYGVNTKNIIEEE